MPPSTIGAGTILLAWMMKSATRACMTSSATPPPTSRAHIINGAAPATARRSRDEMRALDVLGLESDADFEDVKRSWRSLAKECHPDLKPGDAEAAARFQAVQAAYDVLRMVEERKSWRPG